MTVKKRRSMLNPLVHDIDVGLVKCGGPNLVFVLKSGEKVSCAGGAIPNVVMLLPVLSKNCRKCVLRFLNPHLWREIGSFSLAHVLGNEKIPSVLDGFPVFAFRRAAVPVPEQIMRLPFVAELRTLGIDKAGRIKSAIKVIVIMIQDNEELFDKCGVFFRKKIRKKEIGVKNSLFLGAVPIYGNGRLHVANPFLIDKNKIVSRNSECCGSCASENKVPADERSQFRSIFVETENNHLSVKKRMNTGEEKTELARCRIRRGDIPVKIVLVEQIHQFVIGDKGNLFGIKSSEKWRRKMIVESSRLAQREDKLGK